MTPERDKPQTDPSPPDQGAGTLTLERPPGLSLTSDDTLTLDLPAADCLEGYRDIRLAVATPRIRLGDVQKNEEEILALIDEARQAGADVLLFSDMPLTGRTAGDLFFQRSLQDACLESLARITRATAASRLLVLISLPLRLEDRLYKATAILYRGEIVGMTPAAHLSHEDQRWFSDLYKPQGAERGDFSCQLITEAGPDTDEKGMTRLQLPPIECPTILRHVIDPPLPGPASHEEATGLAFSLCDMTPQSFRSFSFRFVNLCTVIPCLAVRPSLLPGSLEACRDVRLFNFDSHEAAEALSRGSIPLAAIADARPEWTGDYRRIRAELIRRSLADHSIILYAGAGQGESSSQGIYAGHRLIISDGRLLAEGPAFSQGLTLADIAPADLFQVRRDESPRWDIFKADIALPDEAAPVDPYPFLMRGDLDRASFYQETLAIQARGLADRLEFLGARPVLGLSGGLDSAHALIVCLEAVRLMGRPSRDILALSMPGPGSSEKSQALAAQLGQALKVDFRQIDIHQAVQDHLETIGHPGGQDLTFENAQARERTQILMDLANLEGGLVVGTGDLSELALGWSTYNGDHMSMYAVNASLTKTVIREMVATTARLLEKGQSSLAADPEKAHSAASALTEILGRPVSPELIPPGPGDQLVQLTESLVGPYPLVDFFLWHLIFKGRKVTAVYQLALAAFGDGYPADSIAGWLAGFIQRFFKNQFKRSASPEGVAAFPWQLVPQVAWQMPGDALPQVWLDQLEAYRKESR